MTVELEHGAAIEVHVGERSCQIQSEMSYLATDRADDEAILISASDGAVIWHVPEDEEVHRTRDGGVAVEIL